jgi:hypothetical protein
MVNLRSFAATTLLAVVAGCATPVPFDYAPPPQLVASAHHVLIVERVHDGRIGAQPIDKVLDQPAADAIAVALLAEMRERPVQPSRACGPDGGWRGDRR